MKRSNMKFNFSKFIIHLFLTINFLILKINSFNKNIGILSPLNINCGIAVYSTHLEKSFKKLGYNVFLINKNMNTEQIIDIIKLNKINIIDIQYEYEYFKHLDFKVLFNECKKNKTKVYTTVHNEHDLEHILESDGLIFHKKSNHLNIEKYIIIPIGCPVFSKNIDKKLLRKKYNFSNKDLILSTCGFMFTWKNVSNILELLIPWLNLSKYHKIQLLTPFSTFGYSDSMIEFLKINEIIKKNNLMSQVIHITDFLSEKELNERLSISNLGFLWSNKNSDASSASIKQLISARLPGVVTLNSHFQDIDEGFIKVKEEINSFVNEIVKSISNSEILVNKKRIINNIYNILNYDEISKIRLKIYFQ